MADLEFDSNQVHMPGGKSAMVCRVMGAVDGTTVRMFEEEVMGYFDRGVTGLVLDFAELQYINSTGMGLMVKLMDKYEEIDGKICLASVSPKIADLFDMLGLLSLFAVYDNAGAALMGLGGVTPAAGVEDAAPAPEESAPEPLFEEPETALEAPESVFVAQEGPFSEPEPAFEARESEETLEPWFEARDPRFEEEERQSLLEEQEFEEPRFEEQVPCFEPAEPEVSYAVDFGDSAPIFEDPAAEVPDATLERPAPLVEEGALAMDDGDDSSMDLPIVMEEEEEDLLSADAEVGLEEPIDSSAYGIAGADRSPEVVAEQRGVDSTREGLPSWTPQLTRGGLRPPCTPQFQSIDAPVPGVGERSDPAGAAAIDESPVVVDEPVGAGPVADRGPAVLDAGPAASMEKGPPLSTHCEAGTRPAVAFEQVEAVEALEMPAEFIEMDEAFGSFEERAATASPAGVEFPFDHACGFCHGALEIARTGKYKCPRCSNYLEVDESGEVNDYAAYNPKILELKVPAAADFLSQVKTLIQLMARQAHIGGRSFIDLTKAVETITDLIRERATAPGGTLQVTAVSNNSSLAVSIKTSIPIFGVSTGGDARLKVLSSLVDLVELVALTSSHGEMIKLVKKQA